jgi:hypothetical protein
MRNGCIESYFLDFSTRLLSQSFAGEILKKNFSNNLPVGTPLQPSTNKFLVSHENETVNGFKLLPPISLLL